MLKPIYAVMAAALALHLNRNAVAQVEEASQRSMPAVERATQRLNSISIAQKQQLIPKLDQELNRLSVEANSIAVGRQSQQISNAAAAKQIAKVSEAVSAVQVAKKVLQGVPVAPDKLQQVDEVIRWITRPIWVICGGMPWFPDSGATADPTDFVPIVQPRAPLLQTVARSTGLITGYDVLGVDKQQRFQLKDRGPLATAVVIGKNRVLTNKHVVTDGGMGFLNLTTNLWTLYDGLLFKIEFPYEYNRCAGPSPSTMVTITKIEYVDPDLDFAILQTDKELPPQIPMTEVDDAEPGDRVVVIGYPTRPGDGNSPLSPLQIDKVFSAPNGRTPFPAERMAAGMVFRESTVPDGYFAHDASTWGGNSGSIVVNLATGRVAGLHARGLESRNEGVGYNEAVLASRILAVIKKL